MLETIEGATPVDAGDIAFLIPRHIRTQQELNAWEHAGIMQAVPWALRKKDILNSAFFRSLHRKMFAKTWRWAGQYRRRQTNIGIEPYLIETHLHMVCDDVTQQIENTVYPLEEICVRLHHRLVFIHPFVNGNGRHARLICDLMAAPLGVCAFSWGAGGGQSLEFTNVTDVRRAYIDALRRADHFDFEPLLRFARS